MNDLKREPIVLKNAKIPVSLVEAVEKEIERKGYKSFTQVLIWGLRQFMLTSNKAEAERLGIKPE